MSRKLTAEERNILLDNPELVMFDPYSAIKTHICSLGMALIPPTVCGVLVLLWGLLCPHFINSNPKLFASAGCAVLIIASGSVPALFFILDDLTFRKARREHYRRQLRMLLPDDLECKLTRIQWVTAEKAEGGWVLDGREEMFGYSSYVNYFRIEPNTDLAVIFGTDRFCAFVKPDMKTESFYTGKKKHSQSPEEDCEL